MMKKSSNNGSNKSFFIMIKKMWAKTNIINLTSSHKSGYAK
jgi:hypothetical protein